MHPWFLERSATACARRFYPVRAVPREGLQPPGITSPNGPKLCCFPPVVEMSTPGQAHLPNEHISRKVMLPLGKLHKKRQPNPERSHQMAETSEADFNHFCFHQATSIIDQHDRNTIRV